MADEAPNDQPAPPAQPSAAPAAASTTATGPTKLDDGRTAIGDPDAPLTPTGDTKLTETIGDGSNGAPPVEGDVTHRLGGTLQREPTPEELPQDAKVSPLGEQVAPNSAPISVGARPQPEEIAGVEQPTEGLKTLPPDGKQPAASDYLSETSDQHDDADRADEDAQRDSDRGRY